MALRDRLEQQRFDSPGQQAMLALLVASGQVRRDLQEVCQQHGLTHDQYNVLRILRGVHPEGHPRYEVARRLIDRSPDVTRLLDRLERRDLVERSRSAEDRRLSISRITAAGLELLEAMEADVLAVHEHHAARLSEPEQRRLGELCEVLIE